MASPTSSIVSPTLHRAEQIPLLLYRRYVPQNLFSPLVQPTSREPACPTSAAHDSDMKVLSSPLQYSDPTPLGQPHVRRVPPASCRSSKDPRDRRDVVKYTFPAHLLLH